MLLELILIIIKKSQVLIAFTSFLEYNGFGASYFVIQLQICVVNPISEYCAFHAFQIFLFYCVQ